MAPRKRHKLIFSPRESRNFSNCIENTSTSRKELPNSPNIPSCISKKHEKLSYYKGDVFQNSRSPEISSINTNFSANFKREKSPPIESCSQSFKSVPIYNSVENDDLEDNNPEDVFNFPTTLSPIRKIYQNQFPSLKGEALKKNKRRLLFSKTELNLINDSKCDLDNIDETYWENRSSFHRFRSLSDVRNKMRLIMRQTTKAALKLKFT